MTCIPFGSKDAESPRVFICVNDLHRLHVGNRCYWMEWHYFCGPSFYEDHGCTKPYYPDEDDPIWDAFQAWHDKRKATISGAQPPLTNESTSESLCNTCIKADVSCPIYPQDTQNCVEYDAGNGCAMIQAAEKGE